MNINNQSPGIYIILNKLKPKRAYIGQANNFNTRWTYHKHMLLTQTHTNKFLQNDFDKILIESFKNNNILFVMDVIKFDVLEEIENETKEHMTEREEFWINKYIADGYELYNHQKSPTSILLGNLQKKYIEQQNKKKRK